MSMNSDPLLRKNSFRLSGAALVLSGALLASCTSSETGKPVKPDASFAPSCPAPAETPTDPDPPVDAAILLGAPYPLKPADLLGTNGDAAQKAAWDHLKSQASTLLGPTDGWTVAAGVDYANPLEAGHAFAEARALVDLAHTKLDIPESAKPAAAYIGPVGLAELDFTQTTPPADTCNLA